MFSFIASGTHYMGTPDFATDTRQGTSLIFFTGNQTGAYDKDSSGNITIRTGTSYQKTGDMNLTTGDAAALGFV